MWLLRFCETLITGAINFMRTLITQQWNPMCAQKILNFTLECEIIKTTESINVPASVYPNHQLFKVGNKLFPPLNRKPETKWFKSAFLFGRCARLSDRATSLIRIGILCYSTKYIIWRHFLTEHFVSSSVTFPMFKGGRMSTCDDHAKSFNESRSETKILAHLLCYVTLKLWESNRLNLLNELDMVMDVILCTSRLDTLVCQFVRWPRKKPHTVKMPRWTPLSHIGPS